MLNKLRIIKLVLSLAQFCQIKVDRTGRNISGVASFSNIEDWQKARRFIRSMGEQYRGSSMNSNREALALSFVTTMILPDNDLERELGRGNLTFI